MRSKANSPTPRRGHRFFRRILWATGASLAFCLGAFLIYFPGRQSLLAVTLATGLGVTSLQMQVEQVEDKAIEGRELSLSEKQFLLDLYTCLAKGGH